MKVVLVTMPFISESQREIYRITDDISIGKSHIVKKIWRLINGKKSYEFTTYNKPFFVYETFQKGKMDLLYVADS